MKQTIALLLLSICAVSCNENSFKTSKEIHRERWNNYCDSFIKYTSIRTDCGDKLREHYFKLSQNEYKLMYPNGNPAAYNKKIDTVCYPVK